MATKYWIINKATLSYTYTPYLKPEGRFQNQHVDLFAQRSYTFEASKDGEWDPPLSDLTSSDNKFRLVQTDGTTASIKLPELVTGFTGTEGKEYKTMANGGTYYIIDRVKEYNPDTQRWTTFITVAGSWDKAKKVKLTDETRKNWI